MYSTFQSHEPEFDYLKSLEIEEKINKIRWLKRANPAHFLLSTNGKIIALRLTCNKFDQFVEFILSSLWSFSRQDGQAMEGHGADEAAGRLQPERRDGRVARPDLHPHTPRSSIQSTSAITLNARSFPLFLISCLPLQPMDLMVEASPRRTFANAHAYHINSISVNSDQQTFMSADDLRINLWHLEITDQSFSMFFHLQKHCTPMMILNTIRLYPLAVFLVNVFVLFQISWTSSPPTWKN